VLLDGSQTDYNAIKKLKGLLENKRNARPAISFCQGFVTQRARQKLSIAR